MPSHIPIAPAAAARDECNGLRPGKAKKADRISGISLEWTICSMGGWVSNCFWRTNAQGRIDLG